MNPKSRLIFIAISAVFVLGAFRNGGAQQLLPDSAPAAAHNLLPCPAKDTSWRKPDSSGGTSSSLLNGPQAVVLGTSAQYTLPGTEAGHPLIWRVNRLAGGDRKLGTISDNGLYSAPLKMPACSTLIIAAQDPLKPWILKHIVITLQTDPSGPAPVPTVVSVDQMGVVMQNPHVVGRDGSWSAAIHGRSYWSFNDTAMNAPNAEGTYFVSNTRSSTANLDASQGIHLDHDHVDSTGMLTEFMPFTAEETTFNAAHGSGSSCSAATDPLCGEAYAIWPGPVIPVPDASDREAYHFYLLILRGGPISGWQVIGLGIAHEHDGVITRPIIRPGTANPTLMWEEPYTTAYGNGGVLVGDILYMTGCDELNIFGFHMCNIARVPLKEVLNPNAWTYYNGNTDQWVSDPTQATMIFYGGAAGNTLYFNPALNEYMTVYSQTYSNEVLFRVAPTPWGPWSDEQNIVDGLDTIGANGANDYAAQPHVEFEEQNGLVQYVTYVQDDSDLGFLGQNLQLVRVRFAP